MQKQNQEQAEQSNGSTYGVEGQTKDKSLNEQEIQVEELDGPFTSVRIRNKWFIALANQRISPEFQNEQELIEWFYNNTWSLTTALILDLISRERQGTLKDLMERGRQAAQMAEKKGPDSKPESL